MILSSYDVRRLLDKSWDDDCPVEPLGLTAKELWDQHYEDYVSDNGNLSEAEHEMFMADQERYALANDKCSFPEFVMLMVADKAMHFTEEEEHKLQRAVETSEADIAGLDDERLLILKQEWQEDCYVIEHELINLLNFISEAKPEHQDWQVAIKNMLTQRKYMRAMCSSIAKRVHTPDVSNPLLLQKKTGETTEEYKARLVAYANSL